MRVPPPPRLSAALPTAASPMSISLSISSVSMSLSVCYVLATMSLPPHEKPLAQQLVHPSDAIPVFNHPLANQPTKDDVFILDESYAPTLLARKAQRLRYQGPRRQLGPARQGMLPWAGCSLQSSDRPCVARRVGRVAQGAVPEISHSTLPSAVDPDMLPGLTLCFLCLRWALLWSCMTAY
jgi:hypothetical protein